MSAATVHRPVMVEEVLRCLDCGPGRVYVDATVGAGGHGAVREVAELILKASGKWDDILKRYLG